MGVYIKSMKMPMHCMECELAIYDNDNQKYCPFTNIMCLNIGVQNDCPLIEVPEPHGKLVDSDMLYASIAKDTYLLTNENNSRDYGMFLIDIWKKTEGAPTVIVRNK